MKCKMLILCYLILLLTCGCKVNYNLYIDKDNNYNEEFYINSEGNEEYTYEDMQIMYSNEYPTKASEDFIYYANYEKLPNVTYYNKSFYTNGNGYTAKYSANYSFEEYKDARAVVTSFASVDTKYNSSSEIYTLELSNLKLFNADNYITRIDVSINVSSNFIVLDNNADEINGNTYSWSFNNKYSKIYLKYQNIDKYNSSKNNQEIKKENNENDDSSIIYVILILIGFFVVLFIILKMKNNKNKF